MTSSDVQRSQRVLDKVGARLGLTDAGKQWLIAAVDPWHDTPVTCTGFPDVNESASVVQVVPLSATISVPNGVTGNWDAHFHQFPWQRVSNLSAGNWSSTVDGNQITGFGDFLVGGDGINTPAPVGHSNINIGGFIVDRVASGSSTFVYNNTNSVVPFDAGLQPYLTGEYRIIGMGFEVINTTSDLNVQGLCTVYRQPCANQDSAKTVLETFGSITTGSNTLFQSGYPSMLNTNMPPSNTAEALLLDGSKQWKAKEGCYVVSTLSSDELPAGTNSVQPCLHLSAVDPLQTGSGFGWAVQIPHGGAQTNYNSLQWTISGATFQILQLPAGNSQFQNFNHSGAIFSGLSNTTTLQVNAKYYIERFPTQQDSALVVLARQGARDDCIARDLYSEIIREMPVGVPQRMNGLGEWFADAVSSAVDFIAPVASAIPHPMAQAIGGGLKVAGGVAKALAGKSGQTYAPSGGNVSVPKPKMKMKVVKAAAVTKKKKKVPK